MPLNEHVYCVAVALKMTKRVVQWICVKFCVKLEHSSEETIRMTQKATAMGNQLLEASSWQCAHSCITSHMCRVFWWNVTSPRWLSPTTAHIWCPTTSGFSKTKITFEREEISDCQWDSGKYDRQLMVIRRTGWGPRVPTLKGTEASLSHVQCFLYLMSSSINVSIFHITWLDTFLTDLVSLLYLIF